MAPVPNPEKLWRYTSLVRLSSWVLIVVGLAMLPMSIIAQLSEGLSVKYVATLIGTTGVTGILFFPLLTMWMKKSRPSAFLVRAKKLSGPRILPAARRDLRRWGLMMGVFLFIATVAMVSFLVGVLANSGPEGIAEGVVVGVLVAWGLVTLEDARAIARAESSEGRTYFAVGHRPTAAGNRLVWTPSGAEPQPE